ALIGDYITAKCGFAAGGKTLDELQSILCERKVSPESCAQLRGLLEQIDALRFGGSAMAAEMKQQLLSSVQASIKTLDALLSKEKRR
ncbi:MAG: hypothetical protein PHC61_12310, partial [Chitinivibrionales bacterium]|nr:hypothetical protein [Chitinivibrionales bacterium]